MLQGEGLSLQDSIRFAVHQRDMAERNGYHDVAAFWADVVETLRAQVPAVAHPSTTNIVAAR
jgi:hypothetical protein